MSGTGKDPAELEDKRQTEQMEPQQQQEWHADSTTMHLYVGDVLPETERERVEAHMAQCDVCLELFMTAVEAAQTVTAANGADVSDMPDMEQMGRRLSGMLFPRRIVQEKPYRRRTWLQHPAVHFGAAAAITLLLLGTGTFNGVAERMMAMDEHTRVMLETGEEPVIVPIAEEERQDGSWSDRMVDQTLGWLKGIEKSRFK
ncbi:zf-HC2 domain-containing protein [Paenibacillus gorillae]|uniref:zf-HC2 domain-containing protein n=1 Tax=Paenibacillus gorillae TaxID=1243662 RepID=UPI0004AE6F3A|nr:zf-HC2 domain-containing protein [Paenibacillus gorillae]